VVSVAEAGAQPNVSLLRALKREFGFYCIELSTEGSAEPDQLEMAFVVGGAGEDDSLLSSMEQSDNELDVWSTTAAMGTARSHFCTCVFAGEAYIIGGDMVMGIVFRVWRSTRPRATRGAPCNLFPEHAPSALRFPWA
jgi:hypothetical protein